MKKLHFTIAILILMSELWAQSAQIDTISVYFPFNKYELTSATLQTLNTYRASSLTNKDSIRIRIVGYTDKIGSDAYNLVLSQQRANSIKKYINTNIVNVLQIQECIGKGKSDTSKMLRVVDKDSLSRRADIYFTYKDKRVQPIQPIQPIDEYKPVLYIDSFKVGKKIKIPNLNFQPGKHILLDDSFNELDNIVRILKENPSLEIEINGHVCCIQPGQTDGLDLETNTWNLSEKRAEVVYNYFIEKGINSNRLRYQGFGGSQRIINPEQTEEDRIINRRVEILVTKQ